MKQHYRLGMDHDSTPECPDGDFIMSTLRSEATSGWSPCSAKIASGLSAKECLFDQEKTENKTNMFPGLIYSAAQQCAIFLV